MPLLFAQWPVIAIGFPGRADHHIVILLLFVLTLGGLLRLVLAPRGRGWPFLLGLVHGFGLWVSVEFLLVLTLSFAVLAVRWLAVSEGRLVGATAAQGLYLSLGLLAMTVLGTGLERPPAELFRPEYDRISIAHLAMAALAALVWWVLARAASSGEAVPGRLARLALLLVAGGGAAGVLLALYPPLLSNPMYFDPVAFAGLRQLITEVEPLFPNTPKRLNTLLIALGLLTLAAPAVAWLAAGRQDAAARLSWGLVAALGLVFLALSLWQMRFASYLSVLLVVPVAALLGTWAEGFRRRLGAWPARSLNGLLLVGALALPYLLQQVHFRVFLDARPEAIRLAAGCRFMEIVPYLNSADEAVAGEKVVVTSLGYATALLYHTRHAVVGTSYHRNVQGLADTYGLMDSVDDGAALALVRRRGIDLFLFCRVAEDPSFATVIDGRPTLFRRLLDGRPPAWLDPLALPGDLGERFRLYGVVEGAS
jgi:hypothetical protein